MNRDTLHSLVFCFVVASLTYAVTNIPQPEAPAAVKADPTCESAKARVKLLEKYQYQCEQKKVKPRK